jgi:Na+/citrate or Na+/malate symporter
MLAAMVVGVRQALDYQSTPRAILVCVLGWVLAGAMAIVIGLLFGPALQ